jgi:hypothetical protein
MARWLSVEQGVASSDVPPLEILMWIGDGSWDELCGLTSV